MSEWTLDYPPFFAWFEKLLAQFAVLVDPKIVQVDNLGYDTLATIYFQRTTVIVSELVLFWALQRMLTVMGNRPLQKIISWSLMLNPGLLMVDNMHFQYNGLLYGILIHSLVDAKQGRLLRSGILFAILLNFKHIYLYIALPYFAFLLRAYCFENSGNSIRAFRPLHFLALGFSVIAIFAASLGPFVVMNQLPQLASRLFPFKRGLCHSYWAANFWALYSFMDRVMIILVSKTGLGQYFNLTLDASALSATTRGLVGDTAFGILPTVTAQHTLLLTALLQVPSLISVFRQPTFDRFIGSLVLAAFSSFLAGWHVHEKAILLCTVTMSVMIAEKIGANPGNNGAGSNSNGSGVPGNAKTSDLLSPRDVRSFLIVSLAGYIGLWPLFFTREETPIKILITVIWFVIVGSGLVQCIPKSLLSTTAKAGPRASIFNVRSMFRCFTSLECLYVFGCIPVQLYSNVIHEALFGLERLEFLPLMITSVYSAVGVVYGWLLYSSEYFSSQRAQDKKKTR
ncbi:glycosyl transferase [Lunasporangiospora selenospora]|uniref:Alpha-1,3-glucosyltransferase n=1 Tax=Lunasporangiospora selenospora TaxID=979761 RepID=A0A9P6G3I9_9FUNG|nr:glycosyl transferase [Lunasporangiospora selenospora]